MCDIDVVTGRRRFQRRDLYGAIQFMKFNTILGFTERDTESGDAASVLAAGDVRRAA